jgi:hypothetical protein
MKKLLKELLALLIVVIIAAGVIFLFTRNIQTSYDTFTGNVHKIPINISSPAYGQILTLPVTEGATVTKKQVLATVQILSPNFTPSTSSNLYSVSGNVLSLQSPVDGTVGSVTLAPNSTVGGTQPFIQIYTLSNLEIQILLPQGKDITDYSAFFASSTPNSRRFPLHILGRIPTDVISNIPATTAVYRAKCQEVSDRGTKEARIIAVAFLAVLARRSREVLSQYEQARICSGLLFRPLSFLVSIKRTEH